MIMLALRLKCSAFYANSFVGFSARKWRFGGHDIKICPITNKSLVNTLKKDKGELTFQEFWTEWMKEAPDSEALEKQKQRLLETLREKGFSEEQINKMKMKEVMTVYTPTLVEKMEKADEALKKIPDLAERTKKAFEELRKPGNRRLLQDEGLRKDLLELMGLFNDLTTETSTTLFLMDEFERFVREKKKQKKREVQGTIPTKQPIKPRLRDPKK